MDQLPMMRLTYDLATIYRIEHAGRVSLPVSRTIAVFFFGIACIAAIGRLIVCLTIRRRLYFDDYVLFFGLASLGAAMGVYIKFSWLIYVLNIIKYDPTVIPTVSDLQDIMNAQAINYSLMALMWSAIFPVKLCFLITFKVLILNMSQRIVVWYWTTLTLVFLVWGFLITESFIICPYTGDALLQHCTPETPYKLTIAGNWFAFVFDAITDLMIVAIPVYILRNVRIRLTQKVAIASFLCLSSAMVVLAIVRLSLSRYKGWGDLATQYILLFIEACVAITMASVAAYRAVFVEHSRQRDREEQALPEEQRRVHHINGKHFQLKEIPADSLSGRVKQLRQDHEGRYLERPKTGGPNLSTVLSFVQKVGRGESHVTGASTHNLNSVGSIDDSTKRKDSII
ncbi:hypothetical protein BU24DRAFT_412086 [Aaosphaeria arxii CBS 175.79]|uniref:Rhodopsin domain-containing protein n=1 Tax=Aaosphaeria arxii CBS 175.79 TaxID=1450172 RepID=A0A6A5XHK4_9PLEO|nr:uncharacterized protein BU24DRAFT_412086 [Aaosphaeria arxii CBS 175.79]KAF2012755.1 hypothetical protein BU24DRAFT_412086 [Aaosphaeria arxii CBS 175.79]